MLTKVTIQNIDANTEFKKVFTRHAAYEFDTLNLQKAVLFAVKREYGYAATISNTDLEESKHHHSDYFLVTDVEYDARVDDTYDILVNGEVQKATKKVNGRLKTRIRVEVKVDSLATKKLGKFEKIMLEWRFNKMAYQTYRIKK
jgi:hypothetical protein